MEINQDYKKMEELYELYEQKIYSVAYLILNNVQQSEDVVQETFITLYNNLAKLNCMNLQELKRYILTIAKNKAIDSYRKNRRQGKLIEEYKKESTENIDENIEEWEQQVISENQIDTLLGVLSESYRQIFKYKVFYNLSYQEISKLMGLTEANVRKQFERARKRLHNMMGGLQIDEISGLKNNV